jgi:hypothetical protein
MKSLFEEAKKRMWNANAKERMWQNERPADLRMEGKQMVIVGMVASLYTMTWCLRCCAAWADRCHCNFDSDAPQVLAIMRAWPHSTAVTRVNLGKRSHLALYSVHGGCCLQNCTHFFADVGIAGFVRCTGIVPASSTESTRRRCCG